jgi:hypothetical protein
MSFDRIDRQFRPRVIRLECAYCSATEGVDHELFRMARYCAPGSKEEPYNPIPLCRPCAAQYHECWDAIEAENRRILEETALSVEEERRAFRI